MSLKRDGDSGAIADDMLTFLDRERLVKTTEFLNP